VPAAANPRVPTSRAPTGDLPVLSFRVAALEGTSPGADVLVGAPCARCRTTARKKAVMDDTDARQAVQESMDRRDQGESR
jgi:hypothetical protein